MYNVGAAVNTYLVEGWMGQAAPPGPYYSGLHDTIDSWFWWDWNPDSADTGGIAQADRTAIGALQEAQASIHEAAI